jgi:hypothetical protein
VKTKTKQTTNNKKKGGSPQNFVTIAALLHKNWRMKKVYRDKDIQMSMQIAAAILIICFIASRI